MIQNKINIFFVKLRNVALYMRTISVVKDAKMATLITDNIFLVYPNLLSFYHILYNILS